MPDASAGIMQIRKTFLEDENDITRMLEANLGSFGFGMLGAEGEVLVADARALYLKFLGPCSSELDANGEWSGLLGSRRSGVVLSRI